VGAGQQWVEPVTALLQLPSRLAESVKLALDLLEYHIFIPGYPFVDYRSVAGLIRYPADGIFLLTDFTGCHLS
jgi:hypothetical protein